MLNRPLFHRSLWAISASALLFGLATDLVYLLSTDFIWVDMSDWLISTGVVVGFAALILGAVESLAAPKWRRPSLIYGLVSLLALIVAAVNMLVHTRDGLTSVAPLGLTLSILTGVLLVAAWWADLATRAYQLPSETTT